ncbi:hypothetical protein EV646_11886 [Kribbella antiqua]|uniref:Uncharacterized protein n=1 Tax=Kribbella antiqua TaxID=2512217 RepID=A0A4R2I830_9ACTN|nr:hypothetical protein [Kribbella antiqua]TCO40172.1 hypothetical protein EV646_11886 [Kribbella antiqua]
MGDEVVAYFWEEDDAEAVAGLLRGEVRSGRFHGEDDDQDHPWVVVARNVHPAGLEYLLNEYDGWLEPAEDEPAAAPPPLPTGPKRFKKT